MSQNDYIKQLEETLAKFLKPLKDIPFTVAIKTLFGYEVLPFNKNNHEDVELLKCIVKAMNIAIDNAYKIGLPTARTNEAGNHIEPFVKNALNNVGLEAGTPITSTGKRQNAGYPDIFIKDNDNRISYLECKTYNKNNINSSFRSFYFHPSKNPKVNHNARHFMVGFEIITEQRHKQPIYVPISWKLFTLEKILVQVKHEFNTSNKELYNSGTLLAEGRISKHKIK